MEWPALRQPKIINNLQTKLTETNMILTMRSGLKVVIASDAYNGIVNNENSYICVLCGINMDMSYKELHKSTIKHKIMMLKFPYDDKLAENLIRKLSEDVSYCTHCNLVISYWDNSHISSAVHTQKLQMATKKGITYKAKH